MPEQYFLNRRVILLPYDDNWPNKFKTRIIAGAGHMFFNKELWELIATVILKYFNGEKQT